MLVYFQLLGFGRIGSAFCHFGVLGEGKKTHQDFVMNLSALICDI